MATRRMKPVDAVLVGFGCTGATVGYALREAGLSVLALERGEMRDTNPDFMIPGMHDELRYAVRNQLFQVPKQTAVTFRNDMSEVALPIREFHGFLPGDGVGGAGVHWNGQTWRFLPSDLTLKSTVTQRYGEK